MAEMSLLFLKYKNVNFFFQNTLWEDSATNVAENLFNTWNANELETQSTIFTFYAKHQNRKQFVSDFYFYIAIFNSFFSNEMWFSDIVVRHREMKLNYRKLISLRPKHIRIKIGSIALRKKCSLTGIMFVASKPGFD